MFASIATVACVAIVLQLICYIMLLPSPRTRPWGSGLLDHHLGTALYFLAHILSLLRLPYTTIPYLTKLVLFHTVRQQYLKYRNDYVRESFRIIGELVNFPITTYVLAQILVTANNPLLACLFYSMAVAELIRLIALHGQVLFSASWQLLPHRKLALTLAGNPSSSLLRRFTAGVISDYISYYSKDSQARLSQVWIWLRNYADGSADLANRLAYTNGFRIIPKTHLLTGGMVRDIASGEIFIHESWTNDPWLLIGIAIRRAPWIFDPRYLRRPFYYRSQAAGLATLVVLRYMRYCPPFAIYQFGWWINRARYVPFYRISRRLGCGIELKVLANGTHENDPIDRWGVYREKHPPYEICHFDSMAWLKRLLGLRIAYPNEHSLWSDSEVVADELCRHRADKHICALDIALRYAYPLRYVEEILLGKIQEALRED